jgi:chromosome segregation ATPase
MACYHIDDCARCGGVVKALEQELATLKASKLDADTNAQEWEAENKEYARLFDVVNESNKELKTRIAELDDNETATSKHVDELEAVIKVLACTLVGIKGEWAQYWIDKATDKVRGKV